MVVVVEVVEVVVVEVVRRSSFVVRRSSFVVLRSSFFVRTHASRVYFSPHFIFRRCFGSIC